MQILDLQGLTIMTDYFVIASGDNVLLVRAVCNGISEYLEERGVYYRRLGWDEARWVLMDYGDVIVHVFKTMPASTTIWSGFGVMRRGFGPSAKARRSAW